MNDQELQQSLADLAARLASLEAAMQIMRDAWAQQIESNRRLTDAHRRQLDELRELSRRLEADCPDEPWRESLREDPDE